MCNFSIIPFSTSGFKGPNPQTINFTCWTGEWGVGGDGAVTSGGAQDTCSARLIRVGATRTGGGQVKGRQTIGSGRTGGAKWI